MDVQIKPIKRKLTTIGNSKGITLPKWIIDQIELQTGDELLIEIKGISHKCPYWDTIPGLNFSATA